MKIQIDLLQPNEYEKIVDLAGSVNLGEKIDFKCIFLAAKDEGGRLVGVSGTSFENSIPRFEHILVRKEHQKTSLAVRLMITTEKLIRDDGHKTYVALIPYSNKMMRKYAIKFGFKEYRPGKNGSWFYKQLQGAL